MRLGTVKHIYVHCTNAHLTTIQHLANIDISCSLTTLHHLIQYVPYSISPSTKTFHSLLTTILHLYDTNHHTTIQSTTHYPTPSQNLTLTQTPRRHCFIITEPNEWARAPRNIRSNNLALLVYTHGLVTAPTTNNYSRTIMHIIDNLYIKVLPPPLNSAILDNLTIFAQHQLTQHYNYFASRSFAKPQQS